MIIEDDFIGIFPNALNPVQCKKFIDQFERMSSLGLTYNRLAVETLKKDEAWGIETTLTFKGNSELCKDFTSVFWPIYHKHYAQKYSVLTNAGKHGICHFKVQKTKPGEGYHIWHFENDGMLHMNRIVTWMVYLNDVYEGGETEFLYLKKRIKPERGTLLIWPAGYTHTHRGNPPLSGDKYIMTGWLEYLTV